MKIAHLWYFLWRFEIFSRMNVYVFSIAEKKVIHYGELRSRATKCGIFDNTEVCSELMKFFLKFLINLKVHVF